MFAEITGPGPRRRDMAGATYVVFGSTDGFAPVVPLANLYPGGGGDGTRGFVLTGIDYQDQSGESISAAGDVNADGIDDLIVGAPSANDGPGESYVIFGATHPFPAVLPFGSLYPGAGGDGSVGFVLKGSDTHSYLGHTVSEAGDVNGDGIDDLILGSFFTDPGGRDGAGESYVVFGSTAGFPALVPIASLLPSNGGDGSKGFVLTGIAENDRAGAAVSTAGDVNGDGIEDIIIGARGADPGGRDGAGESYVVFGRAEAR